MPPALARPVNQSAHVYRQPAASDILTRAQLTPKLDPRPEQSQGPQRLKSTQRIVQQTHDARELASPAEAYLPRLWQELHIGDPGFLGLPTPDRVDFIHERIAILPQAESPAAINLECEPQLPERIRTGLLPDARAAQPQLQSTDERQSSQLRRFSGGRHLGE